MNDTAVDLTDQQPTIIDGRALVPVRGVFETLGFEASWNPGLRHTLDVPKQIIGGSTMLPIRALIEAIGCELIWNENTRTVNILTN